MENQATIVEVEPTFGKTILISLSNNIEGIGNGKIVYGESGSNYEILSCVKKHNLYELHTIDILSTEDIRVGKVLHNGM